MPIGTKNCGTQTDKWEARKLESLKTEASKLVQERAAVVNRLQKVLEWANLKLASVVTDVTGVSARQMLLALAQGSPNEKNSPPGMKVVFSIPDSRLPTPHFQVSEEVETLAQLAKGRLRSKRQELELALTGQIRPHHRFLIANHLTHLDFLEEQIAVFDAQIAQHIQTQVLEVEVPAPSGEQDIPPCNNYSLAWEKAITLLDTIPGVGRQTAELLLAEIGCDMSRFKSEAHLAKWAKLCPGNHESAGKRYSGRTGQGNNWLRSGLIQAAHAAVKCKATYLKAVYQRLVKRRGKQKAIVAVAHRILKAAYQILSKQEPYRDLGANYLDSRSPDKVLNRLCHRIEQLGYQVSLKPSCQGVG